MIEQLTRDNPQLLALEVAYRASSHFDKLLKGSAWEAFERGINMQQFRGEAQYMTQLLFGATEQKYYNTWEYIVSLGLADWLGLGEDDDFGCITFPMGVSGYISRDLLDSILEMYFLEEVYGRGSAGTGVLDVGAGYGRFAHRFETVYPDSYVYCVDAVPVSTFLCDFYLKYRQMDISVIPLHRLDATHFWPIDLAVNIHSFSEMTLSAINFWLDFISDLGIRHLFVVPHDERWVACEPDGSHPSFKPLIEQHGFKLEAERPKYPAGVDGIYPEVIFSFWER